MLGSIGIKTTKQGLRKITSELSIRSYQTLKLENKNIRPAFITGKDSNVQYVLF